MLNLKEKPQFHKSQLSEALEKGGHIKPYVAIRWLFGTVEKGELLLQLLAERVVKIIRTVKEDTNVEKIKFSAINELFI